MAVSCDETADGTNKSGNFNPLMMLATPDNAARVDDREIRLLSICKGRDGDKLSTCLRNFWDTYDPSDKRREVIPDQILYDCRNLD